MPNPPPSQPVRRRRARPGLTLLELLVVVFILAALAASAVSLTGGVKRQARFDQTRNRLEQIRSAMLGQTGDGSGAQRLAGYVTDLGTLPDNLDTLIRRPGDLAAFALTSPVFDPTPDADGFNDGSGDGITLNEDRERLLKGYRGPYLTVPASISKPAMFRDGWGNTHPDPAKDDANHGWRLSPAGVPNAEDPLTITSVGADGAVGDGGDSPYDADLAIEIGDHDWRVPLAGWAVPVVNETDAAVPNLRASLLVYVEGRWRRRTTANRVTVEAADSDGPGRAEIVFGGDAASAPIGEHLLVLVQDADTTPHNGEQPYDADPGSAVRRVTDRVRFIARAAQPRTELVIPATTSP